MRRANKQHPIPYPRVYLAPVPAVDKGRVRGWLLIALLALPGLWAGAVPGALIEKSGEWDRIPDGEYLVENCTWNVKAATNRWHETIFCDPATGSRGWRWDFSGENNATKTYPEIIYGRKPYPVYRSTTARLPTPLAGARFRLEYDYAAKADGRYNTTTDIAFTDSADPGPANIRAKLMIWFDRRDMPFFDGEKKQCAVIGGREHEVYINPDHAEPDGKWVFIALLPKDLPAKGELDLKEYFDYALSVGALKPDWMLSSIEIGSEVACGKGEVVFKRFVVH